MQSNPKAEEKARRQVEMQVRTDRYGDPLPAGAIARLGTVRWRLPRFGVDAMVVPDRKTLVTANALAGISILDRATGRILRQIPSNGEPRPQWLCRNWQVGDGQAGAPQRSTALSADGRTAVFATPDGVLRPTASFTL
jgi:hypothetical protein